MSRRSLIAVWRRPLELSLLTCVGLVAALLGGGAWRVVGWVCLAIPVLVGLRYLFESGQGASRSEPE